MFDHRHRALRLGSHGFSLAEVLIATTVGTIVLLGLYLLYDVNQATFIRGEQQTDLQQNARIGMGRLVRELRLAGRDPSGVLTGGPAIPGGQARCVNPPPGTPQAIENAEAICIRFYADVDLGLVGTERVEYSYDAANQLLRRQQWDKNGASNGAQPLAERVTSAAFRYYDGAGTELVRPVPPGAPLDSIRRISVTITTADIVTGKVPQPFTLRAEIHPRNLGLNP